MKKQSKKNKRTQQVLNQIKAQRAIDRKEYFEEGGEACRWRGLHLVPQVKTTYKRKNKWGNQH